MKYHSISVYQTRYATSIVAIYFNNATVKASTKFYKTTFPYDMIFAKADTSTRDEQFYKLTMELNIHYRYFIGSLIDLFSTRVDLSFSVHKLETFLENPDKVQFEGLVQILIYIRDNNNFGFKYYANINDAPVSELLIQASIKTENRFMAFSRYSW